MQELLGVHFDAAALPAGPSAARLSNRRTHRAQRSQSDRSSELTPAMGVGSTSLADAAHSFAEAVWNARIQSLGDDVWFELQRRVLLTVLDRLWCDHLNRLDDAWTSIPVHKALGRTPLREFEKDVAAAFQTTQSELQLETVGYLMNIDVTVEPADTVDNGQAELSE
jgi:preprotein translocase subunit SecA